VKSVVAFVALVVMSAIYLGCNLGTPRKPERIASIQTVPDGIARLSR
jgi:hypothetical protein